MPHNGPMQLHLDDVALFTRIAKLGTLSAAARERNVPVSQVTRALTRLEAACGVRLLHRTTHGLRLPDTTAELDSELSGKLSGPSGWVRISVSPLMAECVIAPSLAGLYQRWPLLHIDINADDRIADMARDGIDVAIRTGTPASDTLVARQIGEYGRTLYAAPSYLTRCGTPQHPDDLARHHLIANSASPGLNRWSRTGQPGFNVPGHTRADNTALLLSLVVQGVGISRLHDLMAAPWVRSGALVPLLQDHFRSPRIPIYAVMLQERHRLPKVRACIDYWAEWVAGMS